MSSRKSKIVMAFAMAIFGTIGIFRKFIPLSSAVVACVRGFVGTFVLLLFVALSKKKLDGHAIKKNLVKLIVSGALIGFNWIALFEAYNYTTVATATLCYYMAPVIVLLVSPIVLGEKLTLKKTLAIAVAFIGMSLVSGIFTSGGFFGSVKGIVFGLLAAVMYAIVILINKKLKDIGPFDKTIMQLSAAAIVIVPYILFTEDLSQVSLNFTVIIMLIIVGVVHTGLAYAMYFGSMDKLDAATISIYSYIDPALAIILSWAVLGENMDIFGCIGAVLILGATLFVELTDERNS